MKQDLALYQKYRPKKFSEVYGQEQNIKILKNSILNNKIQNGYIFCGQYGTGKTSLARIFSIAINCENFSEKNDIEKGHCVACNAIGKGHPDIIEIDAASNSGIDSIRALREETQIAPLELKRKVYIIDEAHMLSSTAWGGMLKVLEEPELNVTFIFATTNANKIPKTINSRCIELKFNKLNENKMQEWLKNILDLEKIPYKENAIKNILIAANGSFRDALTILDKKILLSGKLELDDLEASKVTSTPQVNDIKKWINLLLNNEAIKALEKLDLFLKHEASPLSIAKLTIFILRDMISKKIEGDRSIELIKLLNVFYDFLKDQKSFFNSEVALEILIIRFLSKNIDNKKKIKNSKNDVISKNIEKENEVNETLNRNLTKVERDGVLLNEFETDISKIAASTKNDIEKKIDISNTDLIVDEIIETTDEIEETLEIEEDTIEIDITSDEIDSIKNSKIIEKSDKVFLLSKLFWEVFVKSARDYENLFPNMWNLTEEGILSILYNALRMEDSQVKEINTKWEFLEKEIMSEKMLPYSALIYDGDLVAMTNDVLVLSFKTPIRAALMNRICRTQTFIDFINKVFGKHYWVISLSKKTWLDFKNTYSQLRQVKVEELASYPFPSTPPIIKKQFKAIKEAHIKATEILKNDSLLKEFDIKIKNKELIWILKKWCSKLKKCKKNWKRK